MSLRANLSHRLLTVWNGEPWHGSNSNVILQGVTADEALAHPLPGAQSIWETVLHMTAWTETAKDPVRGDWPKVSGSSHEEWKAAQGDLYNARKALLEAIEQAHEESFSLHIHKPGDVAGTGATRAHTLNGLADHDVYHLGQIALLKKSLKSSRG